MDDQCGPDEAWKHEGLSARGRMKARESPLLSQQGSINPHGPPRPGTRKIACRKWIVKGLRIGLVVIVARAGVARAADDPPAGTNRPPNRLAKETSPYLLLHAHNPVDWYPWGPEAFAKAKAENKPIFLSVGYSSCYWCHVMERESFVDPEIAKVLNASFVCIKVDREERPDVDQVYMAALQAFGPGAGRCRCS